MQIKDSWLVQALGGVGCKLCAKSQSLGHKEKEPTGAGRLLGLLSQ